ncbi:MAG: FG-GAP repeat domain-containing protein [Promethearchaeota archaeon]
MKKKYRLIGNLIIVGIIMTLSLNFYVNRVTFDDKSNITHRTEEGGSIPLISTECANYWGVPENISLDHRPVDVFLGDANNDGYNDIVCAENYKKNVSIILWNSTSNTYDPYFNRSVGDGYPECVFIGDANNDGYNDIVSGNRGNYGLSILLWNATAEDWDLPITKVNGIDNVGVFVGDANNDGFNDIVLISNYEHEVYIYLWDDALGDWESLLTKFTSAEPLDVFVGDANNDGYNDIVVANQGPWWTDIFLWNELTSDWDFNVFGDGATNGRSVFIGDANNDGYNDMVVSDGFDIELSLWNLTINDWNDEITKTVGYGVGGIFIADVNNDRFNDIVATTVHPNNSMVVIFPWNTTLSAWEDPINITVRPYPYSVFVGDANNDRINDIITANKYNYSLSLILRYPDHIYLEIINQSLNQDQFNITFYLHGVHQFDKTIDDAEIQMWWDGTEISNNVVNLGDGFYFISFTSIFVSSGEEPIILNMTIWGVGFYYEYFEIPIAIEFPQVDNILICKLVDQSFTLYDFNLTFSISNETGDPINTALIQIWWDGVDVSGDVQNYGNGIYFISLVPKPVLPGEEPILLNMTISADGYEDLYYETYFAVDPMVMRKYNGGVPITPMWMVFLMSLLYFGMPAGMIVLIIYLNKKRKSVPL